MTVVRCPRCNATDLERHCDAHVCSDVVCKSCKVHWDPRQRADGTVRWCPPSREKSA